MSALQPFEGDLYILREIKKLHEKWNFRGSVETGTNTGVTAVTLAEITGACFTVENNLETYLSACKYVTNKANDVFTFFDHSPDFLAYALPFIMPNRVFIYLDAHVAPSDCPIKEELQAIEKATKGMKKPVIAIHDFKVPGKDFGYDTYDKFVLELGTIYDNLVAIYGTLDVGWTYYYNTEAIGAKRGIIYIEPKE